MVPCRPGAAAGGGATLVFLSLTPFCKIFCFPPGNNVIMAPLMLSVNGSAPPPPKANVC